MKKYLLIATFAAASVAVVIAQQRDMSQVAVTVTKVSGNVSMLVGAGGNIGITSGEDGIVIVDDQYAPLAPKIKAALRELSDKPLRFVLNTHFHGDHTGGNEAFGREATIIAHTNVRKRLAAGSTRTGNEVPPAPMSALPVVTFDDKMSIHLNGEEVRARHFPHGHTDGDLVITFTRSNVVHMGDHFFNGFFPFIDLNSGGTVRGYLANVERVYAEVNSDVKIIPGHGPLATRDDLKKFVTMLRETTAAVRGGIAKGKSLEQLKSEKVLEKYDSWGKGFIKTDVFIETLHRELSAKKK